MANLLLSKFWFLISFMSRMFFKRWSRVALGVPMALLKLACPTQAPLPPATTGYSNEDIGSSMGYIECIFWIRLPLSASAREV